MRFSISTFLMAFFFISSSFAQLIWTEPVFPHDNEVVTIFFDATQGTGGLEDCGCNVYLHTGVITNQSSGPSDWKHVVTSWGVANNDWKMTLVSGEANVYSYEITPTIRDYYSVPANEIIEQMAFVFRNGDGSLEGKGEGGTDIFYEVYPEDNVFSANLLTPSSNTLIVSLGEMINVSGVASEESTLTLTDNGTQLTQITGTSLDYAIDVQETGTHTVVFTANNNGTDEITSSFIYAVPLTTVVEALPVDTKNGINYIDYNTVTLALYAPNKQHIFLLGDFNNWTVDTDYQLKNTPDGNTWWIEISGLTAGEEYAFQYLVDGDIRVADPYAEKILDPWSDGSIPSNVFPDLKPYPVGQTVGIVSVLQTAQEEYEWNDDDFVHPEVNKLVIYELLMRDFLASHSYVDLLDTLDYLDRLGVTAIELMPVNEFEGNQSWGYNPSFHGALDKYYGTPEAFQDFINEAHNRGIAVILDIVYNHAFGQSPLAQLYWDAPNNRPAVDNPWLNPTAKHPYNVGYDFNHESQATKDYVKQTLAVWTDKYHIDGYRFDLSKGFTQNQTTESNFGNYDASRIAILKDYADFVWSMDADSYVILEHFATNSEEKELAEYGMMIWGNSNHDYNEASMGYTSNFSWVSHKQRGWTVPHVVGYMESHDEERQMYKNSQWGNSSGAYDVTDLETGLSRVELTSAFFFPIPGPKMIWEFGELGYDFSINRCTNGTVNENCRLDPKPIRWDYKDNPNRAKIFSVMQSLIELKKTKEVFSTNDFNYVLSGTMKKIHLNGVESDVTIIGNFGMTLGSINPQFQQTGWWYEFFSGDSLLVNDVNANVALNAGEYRLYSTQQFQPTATNNLSKYNNAIQTFPNPTGGALSVEINFEENHQIEIGLMDLSGHFITQLFEGETIQGQKLNFDLQQPNGLYLLRFNVNGEVFYRKLVLVK